MTRQQVIKETLKIIDSIPAAPFLFVGSGLSRRYIQTESWKGLLKSFAQKVEMDFDQVLASARVEIDDQAMLYPEVGSRMDSKYRSDRWDKAEFQTARDANSDQNLESPLKFEISQLMKNKSRATIPSKYNEEILALKNAVVDGVITTNYDSFLEDHIFDYETYVGQSDLLFTEHYSVHEIYKIHGCHTNPESLILTRQDYQRFNSVNKYLAAKLITIFVEHPIVFLGYSISDPNIRSILVSILECLEHGSLIKEFSKRILFVEWSEELEAEQDYRGEITPHSIDIGGRTHIDVTKITTGSFLPIYEALSKGKRKLSTGLMRRMKEQIYDFVITNEPRGQMHVLANADGVDDDDVEFVVGVGVLERLGEVGLAGIEANDLYLNVANEESTYLSFARGIVETTMPRLFVGRTKLPVFKFLSAAGLLNDEGNLLSDKENPLNNNYPKGVIKIAKKEYSYFRYQVAESTLSSYKDKSVLAVVSEIEDEDTKRPDIKACRYISLVDNPDLAQLSEFLSDNTHLLQDALGADAYRNLVCIYDRLKYGPGFSEYRE